MTASMMYEDLLSRIKTILGRTVEDRFKLGELVDLAIREHVTWDRLAMDCGVSSATLRRYQMTWRMWGDERLLGCNTWTVYELPIWSWDGNVGGSRFNEPDDEDALKVKDRLRVAQASGEHYLRVYQQLHMERTRERANRDRPEVAPPPTPEEVRDLAVNSACVRLQWVITDLERIPLPLTIEHVRRLQTQVDALVKVIT
jgi:hypothetical protein